MAKKKPAPKKSTEATGGQPSKAESRFALAKNSWLVYLDQLLGILAWTDAVYTQVYVANKGKLPIDEKFANLRDEQSMVVQRLIGLLSPLSEEAALLALQEVTPRKTCRTPEPPFEFYKEYGRFDKPLIFSLRDIVREASTVVGSLLSIESEALPNAIKDNLKAALAVLKEFLRMIEEKLPSWWSS